MPSRKWVVRGLVVTVACALAAAAVAYQHWTSPAAIREQLLAQMADKFSGATVTVESAHLRLLGGIAVRELRMCRRDDSNNTTFLYVPSGVIYHDKEQLAAGRLTIRKIELDRPQVRIWRDADGHISLSGILSPPDLNVRIPTILARQATVLIEDRQAAPAAPPLEIRDVNLRLVNDPHLTVTFEGGGQSDCAGPVLLKGRWQRDSSATWVRVEAPGVPVGPPLVGRLSGLCSDLAAHARDLAGQGAFVATLEFDPESDSPWKSEASFTLSNGRLRHPRLPFPLDHLRASITSVDGRIPRLEASGRHGDTTFRLTAEDLVVPGSAAHPACGCPPEGLFRKLQVRIQNLPVDAALFDCLPSEVRPVHDDFLPAGPVHVAYDVEPSGPGTWRKRLLLEPQGMRATYVKFPYTLTGLRGTVEHVSTCGALPATAAGSTAPSGETVHIRLHGLAASRPVHIKAEIKGKKPRQTVTVEVWGDKVPLDGTLLAALPEKHRPVAESFRPTGEMDFHASARLIPPATTFQNRYVITFHGATLRYDGFPLPLDRVSGVLDIQEDRWDLRDFRGGRGDGTFFTSGHGLLGKDGDRIRLDISGRNIALDDELMAALPPDLQATWKTLRPSGRIDFDAGVTLPPRPPGAAATGPERPVPDIDLTVQALGCAMLPDYLRYALTDLRGRVRYARGRVDLEGLTATHGDSRVSLDHGVIVLRPTGGFQADLTYLHAEPILINAEFLRALKEPLRKAVAALEIEGPVELHSRIYVDAPPGPDAPRLYWDGSVVCKDNALKTGVRLEHVTGTVACRGWFNGTDFSGVAGNLDLRELSVFGQPLRDLRGEILMTEDEPNVLRLPGLMAGYCGGQVYGPLRVELGPRPKFELNLTASQVRLEEFGRHNLGKATELTGQAVARLYLRGEGDDLGSLRGSGRVDVPAGKMYNLPLLLDLLKFLGLRLPDRTAFEEAHAVFDIEGPRALVRQLELYGNAISLRGKGSVAFDGTVDLDFNVDWARFGQVLPPGVREIPRGLSNQLLKITMRGKPDNLHFTKQPVPLLTDPIKKIFSGEGS